MSELETTSTGDDDYDNGLVRFKIAALRECIAALEEEGPGKIVMLEMDGIDPEFFTFRFSLTGAALERLDVIAKDAGMYVDPEVSA